MAEPLTGSRSLMGVVNVTPDSFSDGGRWATTDAAIAHGRDLLADGRRHPRHRRRVDPARRHPAAGRGGAGPGRPGDPGPGRRRRRRLGRHHALRGGRRRRWPPAPRSSTTSPAGWPTLGSSTWWPRRDATYVCMHWRAHSDRMQRLRGVRRPGGVVAAVRDELCERVDAARAAGIARRADRPRPGAGLRQEGRAQLGACWPASPVLAVAGLPRCWSAPAASRSSASLLADPDGAPRPVDEREAATTALTVLLAQQRVWGIRVHDVRASRDALRTLDRWERGTRRAEPRCRDPTRRALGDRDRVLRPPRRLRARAARGPGFRRSTSSLGRRHPRPRRRPTTCTTPSTTEVSWRTVKAAVESDPVDLIETLAQRISDVCLLDDRVEWARVTVHKPGAPIEATFADVTLTITRPITDVRAPRSQ